MKLYLFSPRGVLRNAMGAMTALGLFSQAVAVSAAPPQPATEPAKPVDKPTNSLVKTAAVKRPEPLHLTAPRRVPLSNPSPLEGMTFQAYKPPRERLAITSYKRVGDKITSTQLGLYIPSPPGTKESDWLVYDAQRTSPGSDYDVLSSPQFSPDGRYVLFQFGAPWDSLNKHWLYVLDTQTQALKRIPTGSISYDVASWSPDGDYIAFIQNGDIHGGTIVLFDNYIGPLILSVCNWRTGEIHSVATNDTVNSKWNWLAPHTLLYSLLTPEDQKLFEQQYTASDEEKAKWVKDLMTPGAPQRVVPRPNIYAYSVEERKSRLLIRDGIYPTPSPDGKRIVFYGAASRREPTPLGNFWNSLSHGAALCVANIDGTERKDLDIKWGVYPMLQWLPDNEHLLVMEQTKYSPESEAEIKELDIANKTYRQIATLKANDYKKMPTVYESPTFKPIGITVEGAQYFVSSLEVIGKDANTSLLTVVNLLYQIDVKTGNIVSPLTVKDASGLDLHDELQPLSSAPQ